MIIDLYPFDFQSSDIEAEERNYFENHVALARQSPGLRFYYTGRLLEHRGVKAERFRAALIGFDETESRASKLPPAVAAAFAEDTRRHLKDMISKRIDGEVIVPFDSRRQGQKCFVMAAEFDLATEKNDLDAAECHYLDEHTMIARKLPGLRHYCIGKLRSVRGADLDRRRMAVLTFDSADAMRDAYRSPVGQELIRDEQETIRNARVWRLDARVEQ